MMDSQVTCPPIARCCPMVLCSIMRKAKYNKFMRVHDATMYNKELVFLVFSVVSLPGIKRHKT